MPGRPRARRRPGRRGDRAGRCWRPRPWWRARPRRWPAGWPRPAASPGDEGEQQAAGEGVARAGLVAGRHLEGGNVLGPALGVERVGAVAAELHDHLVCSAVAHPGRAVRGGALAADALRLVQVRADQVEVGEARVQAVPAPARVVDGVQAGEDAPLARAAQQPGQRLAVEGRHHQRPADVEPARPGALQRALDVARRELAARSRVVEEAALAVASVEHHRGGGERLASCARRWCRARASAPRATARRRAGRRPRSRRARYAPRAAPEPSPSRARSLRWRARPSRPA